MNIKKILFLFSILFLNFAFAEDEIEEKINFRLNIGLERCPLDHSRGCDSWLEINTKEMTLKGPPSWLRGRYDFRETILGATFSAAVISQKIFNSYDFFVWILYRNGEKILESKFYIIAKTPKDINYTQVYGQTFNDSEFEYKPYFLFNGV